jgi:hypothetical protein
MCIYDILTTSANFKELFVNTFSQNDRINVSFQIGNISSNGSCSLSTIYNGNDTFYNNTITIDEDLFNGTHSNFEITRTIVHEFIHAYLNVLNTECSNYCSTCIFNGVDLASALDEFYTNNCSVSPNSMGVVVDQSEHAFMFDYMLPAIESVFADVNEILNTVSMTNGLNQHEIIRDPNGIFPDEDFNFQKFYHYFSMSGLSANSSFQESIANDPYQKFQYEQYFLAGKQMSKGCQ